MLTQYVGGIEWNATNHIVKAEAMSISYGIKYNPELSKTEGRVVGLTFTTVSMKSSEVSFNLNKARSLAVFNDLGVASHN